MHSVNGCWQLTNFIVLPLVINRRQSTIVDRPFLHFMHSGLRQLYSFPLPA